MEIKNTKVTYHYTKYCEVIPTPSTESLSISIDLESLNNDISDELKIVKVSDVTVSCKIPLNLMQYSEAVHAKPTYVLESANECTGFEVLMNESYFKVLHKHFSFDVYSTDLDDPNISLVFDNESEIKNYIGVQAFDTLVELIRTNEPAILREFQMYKKFQDIEIFSKTVEHIMSTLEDSGPFFEPSNTFKVQLVVNGTNFDSGNPIEVQYDITKGTVSKLDQITMNSIHFDKASKQWVDWKWKNNGHDKGMIEFVAPDKWGHYQFYYYNQFYYYKTSKMARGKSDIIMVGPVFSLSCTLDNGIIGVAWKQISGNSYSPWIGLYKKCEIDQTCFVECRRPPKGVREATFSKDKLDHISEYEIRLFATEYREVARIPLV